MIKYYYNDQLLLQITGLTARTKDYKNQIRTRTFNSIPALERFIKQHKYKLFKIVKETLEKK